MDPRAVNELSARGLVRAARWAAEALCGMAGDVPVPAPSALGARTLRGKAYFDNHEYDRCWQMLRPDDGDVARFLRLYSRYLAGEAAKYAGDSGKGSPNPYLPELRKALHNDEDPFMLYLFGVVLRRQKRIEDAIDALRRSLLCFPYNWSAWLELLACTANIGEINSLAADLEVHGVDSVMVKMFRLQGNQECLQSEAASESLLRDLRAVFPEFGHLDVQQAAIYVHNIEYEAATKMFEEVLEKDPHRLEGLDVYSNMLYVTEQSARLSRLAYMAAKTDKFAAESCCVIANHYGLQGEHDRAVEYYKRALVANHEYLPAWTLLGHEFVELQNTKAAIECYQTAVDINKRDFRAWYGLGQAYEVEENFAYARYFYQRALALRPGDVRMWAALANCYEKTRQGERAVSLYEQALQIGGADPFLCYKLGGLYELNDNLNEAARCMELCVQCDDDESEWAGHAHLWLARRALDAGDFDTALRHASAAEGTAQLLEDARSVARDAAAQGGRS